MNKRSKKSVSLLISAILVFSFILAGCNSNKDKPGAASSAAAGTSTSQNESTPMPQVTLTTMGVIPVGIETLINGDLANRPFNKELTKQTGVTIKYTMTTNEDYDTKMNLMIASGEAPDYFSLPSNYPGGAAKALQDGLIVDLSKYLDTDLPNMKKLFDAHPEWKKDAMTDSGAMVALPNIQDSKAMIVFSGPMLRKDLLDKANLPVPETIDDWHNVLTAFKKLGVKNPFTSLDWFPYYTGDFAGTFGANGPGYTLILDTDGKPVYGPIKPGYKNYLATMNQWYKEGLIDPDFVTLQDWGLLDTKMTSGDSAATTMFLSKIASYTDEGKKTDPNFQMIAAPHPVVNKGDTPYLGQLDHFVRPAVVLNAKSKHLKEMLRFFDYGYSEAGQLLYNFGVEGESYKLVDGKPVYTDLIMANPNSKGWTQQQALDMYISTNDATVATLGYFEQTKVNTDAQRDAVAKWSNFKVSTLYPYVTPNEAETEVIKKLADIDTYTSEMTAKFILGTEPTANFDKYVEHVKSMGIDEVIAAEQSALDRYNKR